MSILSGYDEHEKEGTLINLKLLEADYKEEEQEFDEVVEEAPWEDGDLKEIKKYELAITGNAFQMMLEAINDPSESQEVKTLNKRLISHAKIYARMSPDHKAMLVEQLQVGLDDMIGM